MAYLINSSIKMYISMMLEINLIEIFYDIIDAYEMGHQKEARKQIKKYERMSRLIDLGYKMMIDGKLKEWDWKWLYDNDELSEMDWKWFKKDLKMVGLNKNKYFKK